LHFDHEFVVTGFQQGKFHLPFLGVTVYDSLTVRVIDESTGFLVHFLVFPEKVVLAQHFRGKVPESSHFRVEVEFDGPSVFPH
jgi:hypothetical protein